MAGATIGSAKTEVGLVLQGGGALGAYEWGAILALLDLMDEAERAGRKIDLRIVTGVSIGAINAACIVGAENRNDARPQRANLPQSFVQVDDRINQLRFGNRLSQDASNAKRINELLAIIENLVRYAPPEQQAAPLALLDRLQRVETVEVKLSQDGAYAEPTAFRDFSQQGIEHRRERGYDAARAALKQYFPATLAA